MMKHKNWRSGLLVISAMLLAPLAANAVPVVYTIASGGLYGERICVNAANCLGTTEFNYAAPPGGHDPGTGTITLDSTAGTVAFSVSVASATFLAVGDVPDNGVDEIEFSSVVYSGTLSGVTFTPGGGGITTISWTAQTPAGTSVVGTYEQLLNGGNVNGPDAFADTARVSAGLCTLNGFGALTCGFVFGPGGPFDLNVGPDGSPVVRRAVHSLNVVAVPEPGTAILLALGVVGIALRGRSR